MLSLWCQIKCQHYQVTFQALTMLNKEATAMDIIKVSAKSRSTAVAGAIAGVIRENGRAEAQAIGAGAVNQAIKAVAIARGYLALGWFGCRLHPLIY